MAKKKSHEEFIKLFKSKNINSNNLEILTKYEGKYTNMSVKCLSCNSIFNVRADHLLTIKACPECTNKLKHINQRLSREEFFSRISKDNNFEFLSDYVNMRTKIKIKCLDCNNIFETSPQCLVRGSRCPYCVRLQNSNNQKLTQDDFNNRVSDFIVLDDYINSKSYIHIKCKKCSTIKYVLAHSAPFISCNVCNKGSSLIENEIYNFIKENYSGPIIRNSRSILKNKELDIYLPELNFAIEYDSFYYHNSNVVDRLYHKRKTDDCSSLGITLFHIFETEWRDKQDIVKSKILYKLNKIENKIYARNCSIKEVSTKDKNKFLDTNHIQGHDTSYKNYGLYYKDRLVSVLTISKPRIIYGKTSKYYELSRYATDINYNIVGGFTKLLKYMFKDNNLDSIITFADLRYSSINNLYSNFELMSITVPNYYYYYKRKLYHRYNFTKYRIKKRFPEIYSDNKTELEMMTELGALRIYDCGNAKYLIRA